MDLSIFGPFLQIFNILKVVFGHLWQFIVPPFLFLIAFISWVYYRQGQYARSLKFILLNINVSGENIRTAFAAEQIMAGLHGVLSPRDPVEKYWLGEFQEAFSFEIVGINGHVNFVIRTPEQFRDLVEAHVYAQYPEAEIAEVQDYAGEIPDEITAADSPWEIWGTEMTLAREDAYPIKTYVDIEMATQAAPDEAKLDPLAGLLEVMSNLREGEQMWMQIIAEPTDDSWKDEGEALVRKLIGVKEPKKKSGVLKDFVNEWTEVLVQGVTQAPFAPPTFAAKSEEKDEGPHSLMQFLSPGEQEAVKAIQRNISKVGYRNKIRMIYLARKDVYDKSVLKSRSAAFIGAFTQFATTNLNTFKLTRKTLAHYWFPSRRLNKRKRQILGEYKSRSLSDGGSYFLNIEELATLFHFPTITVKAPMVERIEVKKAMPPKGLPTV